jgi:hypothetical protein
VRVLILNEYPGLSPDWISLWQILSPEREGVKLGQREEQNLETTVRGFFMIPGSLGDTTHVC